MVLSFLVFVSCGVPGSSQAPEAPPLDDAAQRACAVFEPKAADIREGRLTGPPLFRALQDVFNEARLSETEGFSVAVQSLYSASIAGDQPVKQQRLDEIARACDAA